MYVKPMMLDEKLGTQLPVNFLDSATTYELYGIEVELEGKGGISNPPIEVLDEWTKVNDGSLRKLAPGDEAIEYVTRVPRTKLKTLRSLKRLMEFLTGPGKVVYDSYRTSIHVHVNCMADQLVHVYNFITLCIIFDELLASQNGEHRIGNNFCLRARDAEGQITDLINSINHHGSIFGLNGGWRYSSINFASLLKFGTIEFRSLECTTDLARIAQWIGVIENMKMASRTFENPQQIIRGFSQAFSVQDFCKMVLGEHAQKYIEVPQFDRMLFEGMRLAQDFAFCSKWVVAQPKKVNNIDKAEYKKAKAFYQQLINNAPQPLANPAAEMQLQQYIHGGDNWAVHAPQPPQPEPMHVLTDGDDDDFFEDEPYIDEEDDF